MGIFHPQIAKPHVLQIKGTPRSVRNCLLDQILDLSIRLLVQEPETVALAKICASVSPHGAELLFHIVCQQLIGRLHAEISGLRSRLLATTPTFPKAGLPGSWIASAPYRQGLEPPICHTNPRFTGFIYTCLTWKMGFLTLIQTVGEQVSLKNIFWESRRV